MKKYDHGTERIKILKYLLANRKELGELTYSKIGNKFYYSPPTLNRLIWYLIGAGLVKRTIAGSTGIFEITNKGIAFLENCE